ncbi:MAG: hypothetical protein WDZ49_06075, partial [Litorilinea sp.]
QTVWCFRRPTHQETDQEADEGTDQEVGQLLGLVINPRRGIVQAFGSESIAPEHLPQTQAVGQMTLVKTDSGEDAVLLEAPFDFCRARIRVALAAGWQVEPKRDLPAEYQLYNDLIWQFAPPQSDKTLAKFFEAAADADAQAVKGEAAEGPSSIDETRLTAEQLDHHAAQLLQHPAMAHWRVQNRMLQQLLRRARAQPPAAAGTGNAGEDAGAEPSGVPAAASTAALIGLVLGELAARPETAEITHAIVTGLQAQAAWLQLAGDTTAANHAHTLAQALPGLGPDENPLLARMIAASIHTDS